MSCTKRSGNGERWYGSAKRQCLQECREAAVEAVSERSHADVSFE